MGLADYTETKWNFPNAIAAADGMHVAIKNPPNASTEFRNYNGFFSIVLMALVDYDYKFIYADVGCQGRISVGGVFRNCEFNKRLSRGELNLPDPRVSEIKGT